MNNFDMISNEQLADVTGGGVKGKAASWLGSKTQSAYKWWKGTDKNGSPSEIYKEARELGRDAGVAGAGLAAGYSLSQEKEK